MSLATPLDPADRIAAAAQAVPGVAGLSSGAIGHIATYLPGRRVDGVRITPELLEVHVTAAWGHPLADLAEAVRQAVAPLVHTPVDVVIEDIEAPESVSPPVSR